MSKLIPENETLLSFVPNVLKSVQGELALFEKIQSHLQVAEDWLAATFLSAPLLETYYKVFITIRNVITNPRKSVVPQLWDTRPTYEGHVSHI